MKDENNKKHIRNIYIDKSLNLLNICKIILLLSGLTYVIGFLIYNNFDFGLILEIISFVFIFIAYYKILENDLTAGKRCIIISMLPIIWLIIFDFIFLFLNLVAVFNDNSSVRQFLYQLEAYIFDISLFVKAILLYKSHSSLNKADETKKSNNYLENFYDKL